jgi:exopolyphosphatase/guanosine-5'-triphosphate,3'-diphosphate pyrophosphatase
MSPKERIAVADLGTNSTRLLVADLEEESGELTQIDRRTTVTRLGEGVDASGELTDEGIARVLQALDLYAEAAREHGAQRLVAVATSAVRDATNGEILERQVRERTGFDVRTITGDEEARLTFLGATARRDTSAPTLVIDIGGGSTEYVVGTPGERPAFHVSTRLGSVRQGERHLSSDPPPRDELEALATAAREIVTTETPAQVREAVHDGIAVAGTATSLAAIDLELEPYDPTKVHGHRLALSACERMLDELAHMSLEDRRQVPGLHPDRAPTIVAGAVILVESMRAFGLESMETSEADILHGVALDGRSGGLGIRGEKG